MASIRMRNTVTLAYHLGVPHTDKGQLIWSLRKDIDTLLELGIQARRPVTYTKEIVQLIGKLQGEMALPEEQEALYKVLDPTTSMDRIIIANQNFMGMPSWVLSKGKLYHNAPARTKGLRNLFPDNPCEFYLGIANPATFIPEMFASQKEKNFDEFVGEADFLELNWSDVVKSIKQENPDCPIVVWCNEDSPIIWPSVLSEITQLGPMAKFKGELDIVLPLLTEEGQKAFRHYLDERPDLSEIQRRRVRAIFLEKFFDDTAVEKEIDFAGWSAGMIAEMTENYEYDIETISRIPGVNLISL